jgi:hypothetical protein
LFWRFSGQDAVRLAQTGTTEADVLTDPRPSAEQVVTASVVQAPVS